jgi:uncharacterized RDD family membrane protein YckC
VTYYPPPASAPAFTDPTNVMGRRIGAYIVDWIPFLIITLFLVLGSSRKITNVPVGYCGSGDTRIGGCVEIGNTAYIIKGGGTGLGLVIGLVYWTIIGMIEGTTGAFLGKRMFGLRVIGADGNLAGLGRGAARGALMVIDAVLCFLIGLLTASLTHPHRRLGDMAATTFVVGKESAGRPVMLTPGAYRPTQYQAPVMPPPTQFGPPPGTYGTSQPPFASDMPAWGATPAAAAPPATNPLEELPPPAFPAPMQPPVQQAAPPQPQWDVARNAWITYDPARAAWLQWNDTTKTWGPIS